MKKKVRFTANPMVKKKNYASAKEYHDAKKSNLVPMNTQELLCIIFAEDKSCTFFYHVPNNVDNSSYGFFRFRGGMYIIDNESIHIAGNGSRVSFYLEGISTPIKMSNIDRETKKVQYTDLSGHKQTSIITKIKGLKFDAKILDTFANRRFSELFTVVKPDKAYLFLMVLVFVSIGLGVGNILASYFFQGV